MKINSLLLRIVISILLFILSFFFQEYKDIYFIILLVSYLLVCFEMYKECFLHILKKDFFDENLLMILATLGAFFIGKYQEGVMVILLFQIGEYLSDLAVDRSRDAIIKTMDLRSDYANIKRVRKTEKVPAEKIKVGDVFVVKPGEKVVLK